MSNRLCVAIPFLLLVVGCGNRPAEPAPGSQAPTEPVPPQAVGTPRAAPQASAAGAEQPPAPGEAAAALALTDTSVKSESAFDSNQWNSAVGLSGGASGRFGGRAALEQVPHEDYATIAPSGFLPTLASPLSTFAADVDTASFTNVHRILREGRLPPRDAVRVEEFVNACRYQLSPPGSRQTFAIEAELAACPWSPGRELVRFALNTAAIDSDKLPPCNFVFLVDVSGSMAAADKLPLFQQAIDLLIEQLRPQDRVSIVTYASGVRVPLDSVSGSERGRIREAVQALHTSGGTNGQGGIQTAYDLATKNKVQGVNRVLLATDGDFNVGIRNADELEQFITERKDQGVFLTVLGFGTGNLKDDRLERLANRGNGTYHYVDSLHTARRVLVEEFGAEMMTIAKDVKLQVEWDARQVARYRLLGYENRALAAQDFRDERKDGGELGAGHNVTALYEIERVADVAPGGVPLATLRVRYKPADGDTSKEIVFPLAAPSEALPQLSENGRIAAAAAAIAMQLRNDEHRGAISPALLGELVAGLNAERNAELVDLVGAACAVIAAQPGDSGGASRDKAEQSAAPHATK